MIQRTLTQPAVFPQQGVPQPQGSYFKSSVSEVFSQESGLYRAEGLQLTQLNTASLTVVPGTSTNNRFQVHVDMLRKSLELCVFPPQAMFSTDLIESKQERVAINGVEPQMIGMLVSYAYTSEVYISKANVQVGPPLSPCPSPS